MSQVPSNVNQTFVQPVSYPTKEVLRQNTIKNLMSSLGLASAIPGQIAEGIQAAEQIDQQKTGQVAGATTSSGLQTRQLSFQEQEFVHDKIQQGQANLNDIASFAQARFNQSQYLESQNIIGFLKTLTPEQAEVLAKSPVALHRQIANLVHTPESMLQFKHGLAEQAALTDMGEIMRRFTTDQGKSPSQHAQDVMLERVQAANEENGGTNPTSELFGQDPEIQHLYRAAVAEKTFNLELAMTQKHAEQALANMAQTSKLSFASGFLGALSNGKLDSPEGPNYVNDLVKNFQSAQKNANSDLSDAALDAMTYETLGTTLKGLDPRYGKALADRILDKLPGSKVSQYIKGNLVTELNNNLVTFYGTNLSLLQTDAGATYSPEALRALNAKADGFMSDGMLSKSYFQKFEREIRPDAERRVNSNERAKDVVYNPLSKNTLSKNDSEAIDRLVSVERNGENGLSKEPQLYANLISHGGAAAITPSILSNIQSYAFSVDPQTFGHGVQIVKALYAANPGDTESLVRSGEIPAKLGNALTLRQETGEDPGSYAARKWAVPNQAFQSALKAANGEVIAGDTLQSRVNNSLSPINPIPENWFINQSWPKYLYTSLTGRPDYTPLSVYKYAETLNMDYFTDFAGRNPAVSEADTYRNIMVPWSEKVKQNVAVFPFGENKTALRLNGVGYAPGASEVQGVPGLYNVRPDEAAASAAQLSIAATRAITEISKSTGRPTKDFRAEADNVFKNPQTGEWVLSIVTNDPYARPVGAVKFNNIKEIIDQNEKLKNIQEPMTAGFKDSDIAKYAGYTMRPIGKLAYWAAEGQAHSDIAGGSSNVRMGWGHWPWETGFWSLGPMPESGTPAQTPEQFISERMKNVADSNKEFMDKHVIIMGR